MQEKTSAEYFNEAVELKKKQLEHINLLGTVCEERHRLERELMDINEAIRKARKTIRETKLQIEITTERGWTCKNAGL